MYRSLTRQLFESALQQLQHHTSKGRFFSTFSPLSVKQMPPRPVLDESEIAGSYLKGSGPGGQKINKTNSAVQLIHIPTNTVVKCQATRSQSQNRKIAKQILAQKVDLLEKGEESRTAIVANVKKKRKASKLKKSRRKYRALEEEKMQKKLGVGLGVGAEVGMESIEKIDVDVTKE